MHMELLIVVSVHENHIIKHTTELHGYSKGRKSFCLIDSTVVGYMLWSVGKWQWVLSSLRNKAWGRCYHHLLKHSWILQANQQNHRKAIWFLSSFLGGNLL